jgi:hypothetical protein
MKVKCEHEVLSFHYPYHKELKKEVIEYLKDHTDVQNRETNIKALMTQWNISTPQIERLKEFALSNLRFFKSLDKKFTFIFNDFWANIYSKNDYAIPHIHNPYPYAFVYFLSSKRNHSPLIFSYDKKKIIPEEGKFILFPGVLIHEVPKNKYEEKRITLAGNIGVKI